MNTITADTSIESLLGGGASATFFGLLEESNELTKEQIKRNKRVDDELSSMTDVVADIQEGISGTVTETVDKLKAGIAYPINRLREDSISAYTGFTDTVTDMRDGLSSKLTDVKTGLSSVGNTFSDKLGEMKGGMSELLESAGTSLSDMSVKMEAFSKLPTEKQLLLASATIAKEVKDTVTNIPNAISGGLSMVSDGLSGLSGFMQSSTGYLKGIFTKANEEDITKGGTTAVGDTKPKSKDDEDAGGLLGNLPIPKGMAKGLGKFGKFAGKMAGKIALPLAVLTAGISFVDGIKNASEIVGKSAEELTGVEKAGAGLASIASDLTFGLISAESIYSEGKQVVDSISNIASDLYAKLPEGMQSVVSDVSGFLFDSKTGIFGGIGSLFDSTINSIADGDWGKVATNMIFGPIRTAFGPDGILARTVDSVFGALPVSFQENITEFVDTIMGMFESIKNFASDLIPDSIKSLFNSAKDSAVGDVVSDGVNTIKGFMGWGKDEQEDSKPIKEKTRTISNVNKQTLSRPMDAKLGGGVEKVTRQLADSKATLAERKKNAKIESVNSSSKIQEAYSGTPQDNPELNQRIQERKAKFDAFVKKRQSRGRSGGITMEEAVGVKDSDTATKKAKERMDTKKEVAPVVINQPAPPQPRQSAGKQLNTSTSIGDTELAVMNSNMLD